MPFSAGTDLADRGAGTGSLGSDCFGPDRRQGRTGDDLGRFDESSFDVGAGCALTTAAPSRSHYAHIPPRAEQLRCRPGPACRPSPNGDTAALSSGGAAPLPGFQPQKDSSNVFSLCSVREAPPLSCQTSQRFVYRPDETGAAEHDFVMRGDAERRHRHRYRRIFYVILDEISQRKIHTIRHNHWP